jgi:hypothetical protein
VIVDTFIPSGISWLLNRYGWKVNADTLKLTEKERQDIEPIMDAVVRQFVADPRVVLALALVGAYAGKIPPRPANAKREKELETELRKALDELKELRNQHTPG